MFELDFDFVYPSYLLCYQQLSKLRKESLDSEAYDTVRAPALTYELSSA